MKLAMQLTLVVLFLALAACSKSHQEEVIRPSGEIVANGPGADGSVHENTKIFFVLKNINKDQTYTLRASIGQTVLSNGTSTADGTLSIDIYESLNAYLSSATTVTSAVTITLPYQNIQNIYEKTFTAGPSSGDYVAVIRGASLSTPGIQFFYDLRLMSAAVLTSFETSTLPILASAGTITPLTIDPGYLNIFSGNSIPSSGAYSINLTSNSTTTQGYPQLFVFADATLSLGNILYSSYTTSTDFNVTNFVTSPTPTIVSSNTLASGVTITGVNFSASGPYIVVKGIISASTYSLTITQ
jgi:hypothetical protein